MKTETPNGTFEKPYHGRPTYVWSVCSSLWFLVSALTVSAQPALPKPPEGTFEVQEWVVFLCDPSQPQANSSGLFLSTLPDFVGGRRPAAAVEKLGEPGPIGIIRFKGDSGGEKVDVLLQTKGGRFLGNWPKAQTRTTGLLWQNLVIGGQAPPSQEPLGANSWWNRLRSADAPFLLKDGRGERFIAYDAEPSLKMPLRVAAGDAAEPYVLTNISVDKDRVTLRDVSFYKQQADGWHTVTLAELPPTKSDQPATKPATMPATRSATRPATTRSATQAATRPSTRRSAATGPTSRPTTLASATQPAARPPGMGIALSAAGIKDASAVLAPWKEKLTAAGLAATDQDLILTILEKNALDPKRLTAVYSLDADQLDQLLPLEVTPQPRKTVRVGLVIVRNIDPGIIAEIETLVGQLGDASWEKRETAQKQLARLGTAAKPKLEILLRTAKDPEVIWRLERLIALLTHDTQGPNVGPGIPQ